LISLAPDIADAPGIGIVAVTHTVPTSTSMPLPSRNSSSANP
jgi:hypothetical protein